MPPRTPTPRSQRPKLVAFVAAICAAAIAAPASARPEGGLYVAGYGFSFQEVARRAIAHNSGGQRFFLLALPEEANALKAKAARPLVVARDQVTAANGVLLVCQRDIDEGRIDPTGLVPRVVAVRGWPSPGSPAMPSGERYFKGEDPASLPASDTALRRLRSACS
jgi:hypothetical protein